MLDSPLNESKNSWLVVWTESRAEKKVASRIAAQGIESWLPTIKQRHRWSDRWREVVLPLFPGYLFARSGLSHLHTLLRTPGVLTVVRAGEQPAVLPDGYVRLLRQAVQSSGFTVQPSQASHKYRVDDEIVVQEGPLAGLRGVVRQLRGATYLVVWVAAVGRGIAFTIGSSLVAPACERSSAFAGAHPSRQH